MSNKRAKRIHKIILGQLSVVVLILVVASLLIFYSQGYRINYKNMKVYKTSVLALKVNPKADSVFINNISYEPKNTVYVNLPAGQYSIRISKEDYFDWNMNLNLEAERFYEFENIKLFQKNPEITELFDQSKIEYLNSPISSLAENAEQNLSSNNYEIWIDSALVTRFSEVISGVMWYSDMKHIIFQKGDAIYIVETNGFNSTKLLTLGTSQPTRFVVGGGGKEIYYVENGKYWKAKIR